MIWAQTPEAQPAGTERRVEAPGPRSVLMATATGPAFSGLKNFVGEGTGTRPQRVELPRFDITLSFQRLNQDPTPDPLVAFAPPYSAGGLALTWAFHWSERFRVEVEASATSQVSVEVDYWTPLRDWGSSVLATVSHRYRHARFSVAQLVAFRRRAWVSPQIGAGLGLGRVDDESYLRYLQRSSDYPIQAWQEKALAEHPSRTETTVRPFLVGAVKVYFTRRAFARLAATIVPAGASQQWTFLAGVGHEWN
jgi:hypothetical protein